MTIGRHVAESSIGTSDSSRSRADILRRTITSARVSAEPQWCRSLCTARSAARTPAAARRPALDGSRTSDNGAAGRPRMRPTTRLRVPRQLRQHSWLRVSPRTVPRSWSSKCSGIRSLHRLACAPTRHDSVRHETRAPPGQQKWRAVRTETPQVSGACGRQMQLF